MLSLGYSVLKNEPPATTNLGEDDKLGVGVSPGILNRAPIFDLISGAENNKWPVANK